MSSHTRLISALFPTYDAAVTAVNALEAAGYDHSHIAIITREPGAHGALGVDVVEHASDTDKEIMQDAVQEGAAGGLAASVVVGLAAIAIPGFGIALAGGWLAAVGMAAAFGTASGLASALVHAGHLEHHAEAYVKAVEAGSTLVSVRCGQEQVTEVEALMAPTATPGVAFEEAA